MLREVSRWPQTTIIAPMARVSATRDLRGPLGAAERLWYDTSRWPSFIDGFGHLVEVEGAWPAPGSRVVWHSTPAGRGRVVEGVVSYEPGVGQTSEVEDPRVRGTQRVGFELLEDGVAITLELDYALRRAIPLVAGVVDLLFIRRAVGDSLRRTLERFARELASDLEPLR
jgi:hypothetical protein